MTSTSFDATKTSGEGTIAPSPEFPIDARLLSGASAAAGLAAHVIGVAAAGRRSLLALAVGGLVLHVRRRAGRHALGRGAPRRGAHVALAGCAWGGLCLSEGAAGRQRHDACGCQNDLLHLVSSWVDLRTTCPRSGRSSQGASRGS